MLKTVVMTKINQLSSQQRLRQLAKTQLGHEFIQHPSPNSPAVPLRQEAVAISINSQLKHLTAGIVGGSEATNLQAGLLSRAHIRAELLLQRQQLNLERVLLLTQDMLSDQVSPEEVDADWFQHFCLLVQDISAQPMQKLWARILASELCQPGRFSLKTLNILRQMTYRDAQALQVAASLACRLNGQQPEQIFFAYTQQASIWRWLRGKHRGALHLSQHHLNYPDILNLIELGILHQTEIETGALGLQQELAFFTNKATLLGRVKVADVALHYYKFTVSGGELLSLLNMTPEPAYWQALEALLEDVIEFQG